MAETSEMKATWPYPLTEVSAERRVPRPAVPRGRAYELVGVDGSLRGGLRPFPGFRRVYELDFYADSNHDETSVVTDFFPVTFRAGAELFAYGFVYRVTRASPDQALADVFIDYYDASCNTWRAGRLLASGVDPTKRMHVEVFGRLGYVFTQGRSPVLFYLKAKTALELSSASSSGCTEPFDLQVLGTTGLAPVPGPGKQPTLRSPEDSTPLGTLFTTEDAERPGAGQVVLTQTSPANSGLFPDLPAPPGLGGGIGGGAFPQVKYSAAELQVGSTNAVETINIEVQANDMLVVFVFARGEAAGSDSGSEGADPTLDVRWQDADIGNDWSEQLTYLPGSTALFEASSNPLEQNMNVRVYYTTTPTAGEGRVRVTTDETVSQLGVCAQCVTNHDPADPFGPIATDVDTNSSTSVSSLTTDLDNQLVIWARGYNNDDNLSAEPSTELWKIQNSSLQFGTTWRGFGTTVATAPTLVPGTVSLPSGPITDLTDWVTVGITINPQVTPPPSESADSNIQSGSACGSVTDSEMVGFTIQVLNPSDEQTDVNPDIQLEWTGFFEDGSPLPVDLVWDVYFGEFGDGAPTLVAEGITETAYSPGQLYPSGQLPFGTEFLWRIVARRTYCPAWLGKSTPDFSFITKAGFDARQLEPGDYAFGYFLFDSQTGRQSALSKVAQVRRVEFEVTGAGGTDTEAEPHYVAMELVWDSSKYDQAYIFRSVKVQDAGGTFIAGILQLDKIIDLEDFETINNGAGTPFPDSQNFRQSVYYYQLEDKQLAFQDTFTEQTLFDDRMPSGGAALMYDGLMVVSSIEADTSSTDVEHRPQDDLYSLGEIRWSSSRVRNPELFPPFNRYVPNIPTNEVTRFIRVGGNVIGFSRDRMYHLRREGRIIRPHEMHEGYGLVNYKALDAVGSQVLYITSKGLKSVDPFGRLDSLRVWDQLLIEDWRADLTSHVSCAFDPLMSTYFMLNKNRDEVACMWFNTSMATTLEDISFAEVRQGNWPRDPLDYDDALVERALWVQNSPKDTDGEILTGFKPRVYVVDFDREKTITATQNVADPIIGNRQTRTLDLTGDGLMRLNINAGVFLNIFEDSCNLDTNHLHGAYIYMVSCPDRPEYEGTRVKVKQFAATAGGFHQIQVVDADSGRWTTGGLPLTNCWLSLSPVYFKWVGHNVALQSSEGFVFGGPDFHRVKQVDGLGASFTNVATQIQASADPPPASIAKWRGQVWEGTDTSPRDTAFPRNTDGSFVTSLAEYESIHWAGFGADATGEYAGRYGVIGATLSPGLEIFVSDCEYRLLSVRAEGKILKSTRSQRAATL